MSYKSQTANRKSQVSNHASSFILQVSRFWLPASCVLIALLAAAPLWGPGMINTRGGGDSPFLLQRTLDMAENLRYGIFPPRWMSHAAYDLGYPFFNHYAALPYYISGGLTALGFSPIVANQSTQTLGFVLAALTMALWANRVFKSRAAVLLAVVAYSFAPFHLVNVYVRGDSLSEFYAFVWYPLILWTLHRLAERPTRDKIAVAALAYGALILTHNVSALIFSPFALLYVVTQYTISSTQITNRKSQITHHKSRFTFHVSQLRYLASCILLPFILGFLLTAWFWIPAIGETKYGQMGDEFTEGYFHYSKHFRGLNLMQLSPTFDYSVAIRTEDAGPFAMGLVQVGVAVIGAGVLVYQIANSKLRTVNCEPRSTEQKSHLQHPASSIQHPISSLYLLFSLILATFMITPFSKPLWDHLPLLEITQFPWRFLSVQALFTAMVSGALGDALTQNARMKPIAIGATIGISGTIIAAALLTLNPDRLLITDEDVTWEKLLLYETFTGNIGTTIRYEYLPQDVVPRLYISESVIDGVIHPMRDGGAILEAKLIQRTPTKQIWRIVLDADTTVAFPLNWWPGWTAKVGNGTTQTYPMPGSGRLAADLVAGTHTVTLKLRNTTLRTIANITSVVTVAIGVAILIKRQVQAEPPSPSQKQREIPLYASGLCAICIFAICLLPPYVGQRFPSSTNSATLFDFHQMPYPHSAPLDFGEARLDILTLSQSTAQPGDTLTVSHSWIYPKATVITGTFRLVSPAEPRHNVPYALAETHFALPCTTPCTTQLNIPKDITRGLYLVQLRIFGSDDPLSVRTAKGRSMGEIYVGAVRVPHGPKHQDNTPVLHTFNDFTLHAVEAQQPNAATLRLKMAWSTAGSPRNWSLSLRLLDIAGKQLTYPEGQPVQYDIQPGYGYLPTSLWLPGERITDYPVIPLPEGLPPGDYVLRVIAYLQATMQGGGEIDVPIHITQPSTLYDLRNACCEQSRKGATILCQTDGIALLGMDLPDTITEGQHLDFHARWNAVSKSTNEVTATWALIAPDNSIVGRTQGPLAPGTSTVLWPRHTWTRVPIHIDLPPQLSEGDYNLQLTLHNDMGTSTTCDISTPITIQPRPRIFEVSDIPHPQVSTFGDSIRLLGYALDQQTDKLDLTIWWQAMVSPGRDYKRFVHIYDPASEHIIVQDDAMPRAWTYPTTWWLASEVVSETLTLDVSAAPEGLYHIAVGWYDPETVTRLPAATADGQPYAMDRVPLNTPLELRK